MKKVKYYYDSENLAYRKIKPLKRRSLGYLALFLLAAGLLGFLAFVVLLNTPFFETPKERILGAEIENLKLQYALLNNKINQIDEVVERIENRDNNLYRVYFNAVAVANESTKSDINVVKRYNELEDFNSSDLVINTKKRVDALSKQAVQQSKSLDVIVELAKEKNKLLSAIPAIQPVRNENLRQIVSGFGYRSDPFTKIRKFHSGMDFSAKTGTPVYASGDGTIDKADNSASGYGKMERIQSTETETSD